MLEQKIYELKISSSSILNVAQSLYNSLAVYNRPQAMLYAQFICSNSNVYLYIAMSI
jgi:hypothetical protein